MSGASGWDSLVTTCDRLAEVYDPGRVRPAQQWAGLWVVAGICAPQFAIFEPVLRRRLFSRTWDEIVPIGEAAARAEAVLCEGT